MFWLTSRFISLDCPWSLISGETLRIEDHTSSLETTARPALTRSHVSLMRHASPNRDLMPGPLRGIVSWQGPLVGELMIACKYPPSPTHAVAFSCTLFHLTASRSYLRC